MFQTFLTKHIPETVATGITLAIYAVGSVLPHDWSLKEWGNLTAIPILGLLLFVALVFLSRQHKAIGKINEKNGETVIGLCERFDSLSAAERQHCREEAEKTREALREDRREHCDKIDKLSESILCMADAVRATNTTAPTKKTRTRRKSQ